MALVTPVVVAVTSELDVVTARRETRVVASLLGFGRIAVAELVIVTSELAWNIVKHAERGDVSLSVVDSARGRALRIAARDTGRPFHDFRTAVEDGNDDRGPIDPLVLWKRRGIGGGLGAVGRFTDELWCEPDAAGKRVIAVRYLSRRIS